MAWDWLLEDIKVVRLRFELSPARAFEFPAFPGSMIRGALGHALRKIECTAHGAKCAVCPEAGDCVYALFFEACADGGATAMAGVEAPRPYVLDIDYGFERRIEPPGSYSLDLLLIGDSAGYAPVVVRAVRRAAEDGLGAGRTPHFVLRVALVTPDNVEHEIYPKRDPRATPGMAWPLSACASGASACDAGAITLHIESPLRLKSRGRFDDSLDFGVIFRNALRRSRLLAGIYGKGQPGKEFDDLFEVAGTVRTTRSDLQWRDESRYSNRQGTAMLMGGVTGTVRYAGDLAPFRPLLHAAEILHIGKGITLGLGRFRRVGISLGVKRTGLPASGRCVTDSPKTAGGGRSCARTEGSGRLRDLRDANVGFRCSFSTRSPTCTLPL